VGVKEVGGDLKSEFRRTKSYLATLGGFLSYSLWVSWLLSVAFGLINELL